MLIFFAFSPLDNLTSSLKFLLKYVQEVFRPWGKGQG